MNGLLSYMYLEQFIQNPLLLHSNFNLILNALNIVVVFYVMSATVPCQSIFLIQISQLDAQSTCQ